MKLTLHSINAVVLLMVVYLVPAVLLLALLLLNVVKSKIFKLACEGALSGTTLKTERTDQVKLAIEMPPLPYDFSFAIEGLLKHVNTLRLLQNWKASSLIIVTPIPFPQYDKPSKLVWQC